MGAGLDGIIFDVSISWASCFSETWCRRTDVACLCPTAARWLLQLIYHSRVIRLERSFRQILSEVVDGISVLLVPQLNWSLTNEDCKAYLFMAARSVLFLLIFFSGPKFSDFCQLTFWKCNHKTHGCSHYRLLPTRNKLKVKVMSICIAPTALYCHLHTLRFIHKRNKSYLPWSFFAFPAASGTHLLTPEGWKAE